MSLEFKLEAFQDELDKDLPIDGIKLQYEAANNPVLYGKWLRLHSTCKKEILRIEAQKKVAIKKSLDYYTGRSEPGEEVCMDTYERSEMKTVLAADSNVLQVETKLQYWGILVDFCSGALDAVKSRGFAIKGMQEIRSFEAGNK